MARDYDPSLGRYIESDPIGLDGGLATFAYAFLDPLSTSDASGLLPDGCLTCLVYGEAGGTNDDCQQAVAAVVFNRMGDGRRFPGQNSPCQVASASGQFDAFGSDRYKRCLKGCLPKNEGYAADRAFFNSAGPFRDNTDNSTFFHDRTRRTPSYIAKRIKSGDMGEVRVPGSSSFRFYKFRR